MRRESNIGVVVQLQLPDGRYAYGRVLQEGAVAFYSTLTKEPGLPPIGDRDYAFVVGVDLAAIRSRRFKEVGFDPPTSPDDEWSPPMMIRDVISGGVELYIKGKILPATEEDVVGLEPVASWSLENLVPRLLELP